MKYLEAAVACFILSIQDVFVLIFFYPLLIVTQMRFYHWLKLRKDFNEKISKAELIKEILDIETSKNKQIIQEGIESAKILVSCTIVGIILSLTLWRVPTFLLVTLFLPQSMG